MLWLQHTKTRYLRQPHVPCDPGLLVKVLHHLADHSTSSVTPSCYIQTASCAQFGRSFLHHVLCGHYSHNNGTSTHNAGMVLYRTCGTKVGIVCATCHHTGLCTKLQKRSQPGIRAILAVLRDEITAQYLQQRKEAAGTPPTLGSNIELLLGVRGRISDMHIYIHKSTCCADA